MFFSSLVCFFVGLGPKPRHAYTLRLLYELMWLAFTSEIEWIWRSGWLTNYSGQFSSCNHHHWLQLKVFQFCCCSTHESVWCVYGLMQWPYVGFFTPDSAHSPSNSHKNAFCTNQITHLMVALGLSTPNLIHKMTFHAVEMTQFLTASCTIYLYYKVNENGAIFTFGSFVNGWKYIWGEMNEVLELECELN